MQPNVNRLVIWSVIATGISTVTVQLVTIREFLSQFHGNEITISLSLFCWLLLTGIGSLVAKSVKSSSLTLYTLLLLLIALWPLLQIVCIRGFREAIFIHGASPGFYQIFFYIMVTTTPYCLLIGFILPYALKVLNRGNGAFTSGELYIRDSIGDISGGVLFSFILVYWLNPFKTIAITSGLMVAVAILLFFSFRKYYLLIAAILAASVFYFLSLNGQFERSTLSRQYGDIFRYLESPYGRIVITKEGPQHTFWESGTPLYSDGNIIGSEEKVHYPMTQLESVRNVLLVSGGLGETLVEVSKYDPDHIDYVELDPHLTGAAMELGFIKKTPSLTVINIDGRSHIKTASKKYDAIIVDLPDPDTFQINRFFTSEFFSLTKKTLSEGGILSFGLKYSPNYISEVRKKKLSTIYHTARIHFQNVMVLPGGEAYFLCRDGELTTDIPARLSMKSIETTYIEWFYGGNVTPERIKMLRESLQAREGTNTDFEPRVINFVFQEWFMKHGVSPKVFLFILAGLATLYLISLRKEEYILFTTGLTTMGVEMLIVFTFQVIYGYVYLRIGSIVTAFLMGLLPGAALANLQKEKKPMNLFWSEIILLSLVLMFLVWVNFFRGELHQFYFLAYCFVFSFFCGYQFPLTTRMIGEQQSPVAGCLAADLTGAALGTLVTGTILIPLWGVQWAIIFLILVKISSNMMTYYITFVQKRF